MGVVPRSSRGLLESVLVVAVAACGATAPAAVPLVAPAAASSPVDAGTQPASDAVQVSPAPDAVVVGPVARTVPSAPAPAVPRVDTPPSSQPGDAEGWYRYAPTPLAASAMPIVYGSPLPSTPGEVHALPFARLNQLENLLRQWDATSVAELRRAVSAAAPADRQTVARAYARFIGSAEPSFLCAELRALMRPTEPLLLTFYPWFEAGCAEDRDAVLVESLPLTFSDRWTFFRGRTAETRHRKELTADVLSRLAVKPTSRARVLEVDGDLQHAIQLLARTKVPAELDAVFELVSRLDDYLSQRTTEASVLDAARRRIYGEVIAEIPDGRARTLLLQRCDRELLDHPLCRYTVNHRPGKTADYNARFAAGSVLDRDSVCATPSSSRGSCRPKADVVRDLRRVGLQVTPPPSRPSGNVSAITVLEAAGRGLAGSPTLAQLVVMVRPALREAVIDNEGVLGADGWFHEAVWVPGARGEIVTSASSSAGVRAGVDARVGLVNTLLHRGGSPWRVMVVKGEGGDNVIAGPATALSAAVAAKLFEPVE